MGDFLRKLNVPEFIANQFTRYLFNDSNLFEILPVLESITIEDINEVVSYLTDDKMAIVTVEG